MFRKSPTTYQSNLITDTNVVLSQKVINDFSNENKWNNRFRTQIVEKIDEDILRPLFHNGFGAPNAPIRVLIGMMILKEARKWSDLILFEEVRYNFLVRSALGYFDMDTPVPCAATYYNLRQAIVEYEKVHGVNLIEEVFNQLTKSQILEFNINGSMVRMDSKLLGSNVAFYSRYELIHDSLRRAYNKNKSLLEQVLCSNHIDILREISNVRGPNVSHLCGKDELEKRLVQFGLIIFFIISKINTHKSPAIEVLREIFSQHYVVVGDIVKLLPKQELKSTGIQSLDDKDADYRKKGETVVKGYTINVTETCNPDNDLNLLTNVIVEPASVGDCAFVEPSIKASEALTLQKIEKLFTDGAYYSPDNTKLCKEKHIDFIIGAVTGSNIRYDLTLDSDDNLIVTDIHTGDKMQAQKTNTSKKDALYKWRVDLPDGTRRYFTQSEVEMRNLRKAILSRPKWLLNIRNNVEATMFHLGHHYANNKSRYRGLYKHKIWANLRCIWINFVRIMNYLTNLKPKLNLNNQKLIGYIKNCSFVFDEFQNLTIFCKFASKKINFWVIQNIFLNFETNIYKEIRTY